MEKFVASLESDKWKAVFFLYETVLKTKSDKLRGSNAKELLYLDKWQVLFNISIVNSSFCYRSTILYSFTRPVVRNMGSIKPEGFVESVSGVRQRYRILRLFSTIPVNIH